MELMYSRLPKEEVYSKESCINRAYCRTDEAEGNELSKTLIKYILKVGAGAVIHPLGKADAGFCPL